MTVAIRPPMIVKPAIVSVISPFSRPATAGNSRTRPTARSASNRYASSAPLISALPTPNNTYAESRTGSVPARAKTRNPTEMTSDPETMLVLRP